MVSVAFTMPVGRLGGGRQPGLGPHRRGAGAADLQPHPDRVTRGVGQAGQRGGGHRRLGAADHPGHAQRHRAGGHDPHVGPVVTGRADPPADGGDVHPAAGGQLVHRGGQVDLGVGLRHPVEVGGPLRGRGRQPQPAGPAGDGVVGGRATAAGPGAPGVGGAEPGGGGAGEGVRGVVGRRRGHA